MPMPQAILQHGKNNTKRLASLCNTTKDTQHTHTSAKRKKPEIFIDHKKSRKNRLKNHLKTNRIGKKQFKTRILVWVEKEANVDAGHLKTQAMAKTAKTQKTETVRRIAQVDVTMTAAIAETIQEPIEVEISMTIGINKKNKCTH
jgi:hypothetical protein